MSGSRGYLKKVMVVALMGKLAMTCAEEGSEDCCCCMDIAYGILGTVGINAGI